jgi:hypothetical protein
VRFAPAPLGRRSTPTLALMKRAVLRVAVVAIFGGVAPLWWPWLSSHLTTTAYVLAGAPERVVPFALGWFIVLVVQLLVGAGVGASISVLPPFFAWVVFHMFLLAGAFVLADASAPFQAMKSLGGWGFEIGLIVALLGCRRASRSIDTDVRAQNGVASEAQAS